MPLGKRELLSVDDRTHSRANVVTRVPHQVRLLLESALRVKDNISFVDKGDPPKRRRQAQQAPGSWVDVFADGIPPERLHLKAAHLGIDSGDRQHLMEHVPPALLG